MDSYQQYHNDSCFQFDLQLITTINTDFINSNNKIKSMNIFFHLYFIGYKAWDILLQLASIN